MKKIVYDNQRNGLLLLNIQNAGRQKLRWKRRADSGQNTGNAVPIKYRKREV